MTLPLLRTAGWAGLVMFTLAAGTGCGGLNPAFVSQIGGNPVNAGPQISGSILVVLNNQTNAPITLDYDSTYQRPGELPVTANSLTSFGIAGAFTFVEDCNLNSIQINSLMVGDEDVGLTSNVFQRPALQCGSILFINVQNVGTTVSASAELF